MEDVLKIYNVSRETYFKLKTYETLVKEWNNKFNLVSKSSVDCLWQRHIIDSLQLANLINKTDKILYDFGSGAGFPAIILAIVSEECFPELKINLIESIGKKTMFLNAVKEELGLKINIIHDRIENLELKKVDVITSRALASLPKLLEYAYPFTKRKTNLIFPKGANWEKEVDEAKKKWTFNCKVIQSQTDESGKILYINNVRRK